MYAQFLSRYFNWCFIKNCFVDYDRDPLYSSIWKSKGKLQHPGCCQQAFLQIVIYVEQTTMVSHSLWNSFTFVVWTFKKMKFGSNVCKISLIMKMFPGCNINPSSVLDVWFSSSFNANICFTIFFKKTYFQCVIDTVKIQFKKFILYMKYHLLLTTLSIISIS